MTNAHLVISKYRNNFLVQQQDGSYALNIKYYPRFYEMSDEDFSQAYEIAKDHFFVILESIFIEYGFKGFSIDGRSGGWVKPITKTNKTVQAVFDDYLSFEEYLLQKKICHMFEMVKEQQKNIKTILEESKNLEGFNSNIERYINI